MSSSRVLFLVLGTMLVLKARCHGPYDHPKNQWQAESTVLELDPYVRMRVAPLEGEGSVVFTKDKQRVRIEWQGVPNPQSSDLIGLWVGNGDVDPRHAVPVHYINCSLLNPDYLGTGSGSGSFVLFNMRWDFHFKLIRGGYRKPTVVAQVPPIKNEIPRAPTSGHLALHADQLSVVVQWISAAPYPQVVEFGPWQPGAPPAAIRRAAAGASKLGDTDDHGMEADLDVLSSCAAAAQAASATNGAEASGSKASDLLGRSKHEAIGLGLGSSIRSSSTYESMRADAGGIQPDSVQPVTCIEPLGDPSYLFRATSFRDTYRPSDMCGYPATSVGFIDPGYIHTVVMSHRLLVPGKRFYYRFGSEEDGWSEGHSFLAPVPPQALQEPDSAAPAPTGITVLAFNDVAMQNPLLFNDWWADGLTFAETYGENSSLLAEHLGSGAEKDANLALMTGDLAYALGYAADWDVFGNQFESAFTQWPLAVAEGNHERDFPGTGDVFENAASDSGGECNVPFMWRWYSPANIHRNPFKSFFSFNMGPVHFLILDSEIPSDLNSDQGRFVAQDLNSIDCGLTPWVVASMHRMMVAPASWRRKHVGDIDNMERLQRDYEKLFLEHQVDLVIQGHEHAYARTCPYKYGECVEDRKISHPESTPAVSTNGKRSSDHNSLEQTSSFVPGTVARQLLGRRGSWELNEIIREARPRAVDIEQLQQEQHKPGSDKGQRSQQQQQQQQQGSGLCANQYSAPAGAPIYLLTGNGGAGFTHGFPHPLPPWVAHGVENVNGYLRISASRDQLSVGAIALQLVDSASRSRQEKHTQEDIQVDAKVMDCVSLRK